MAKGYVIAQINVTDPDVYRKYVGSVQPTLEPFGGVFLVRGGHATSYEGAPPGNRHVVIEFPNLQAASDWYHSDVYAGAKQLRQAASTSVQTIVEGVS